MTRTATSSYVLWSPTTAGTTDADKASKSDSKIRAETESDTELVNRALKAALESARTLAESMEMFAEPADSKIRGD